MSLTLIIGNKNYSTWSLRPWLLLRHFGVPFHEKRLSLFTPGTVEYLKPISPTGCVPVLLDNGLVVWDSLAICEYASEQFLAGKGWPEEVKARAEARSLAAEMHSGFQALRSQWPMNIRLRRRLEVSGRLEADIKRIDTMWRLALQAHGGPWLFGEFSIADAMYAPVVLRFYSYQPALCGEAQAYMRTTLEHPAIVEWMDAGRAETEIIEEDEIDFINKQ